MTETERRSIALAAGKALRAARGGPAAPPAEASPEDETPVEAPLEAPLEEVEAEDIQAEDTETEDTETEDAEAEPDDETQGRRRRSALVLVAAAALALAIAFAGIAGVLWWRAAPDAGRALANDREAVLRAARVDAVIMYTVDYRNPRAAIERWLKVTTGPMHDQAARIPAGTPGLIGKTAVTTSATTEAAAVTTLDPRAGTATVLLSLNVKYQPVKGNPAYARYPFTVSMSRVDGQWQLADLKPMLPGAAS